MSSAPIIMSMTNANAVQRRHLRKLLWIIFGWAAPVIHVSTPDLWACHQPWTVCTLLWLHLFFFSSSSFNSCSKFSKKMLLSGERRQSQCGVSLWDAIETEHACEVLSTDFSRILAANCLAATSECWWSTKIMEILQIQLRFCVCLLAQLKNWPYYENKWLWKCCSGLTNCRCALRDRSRRQRFWELHLVAPAVDADLICVFHPFPIAGFLIQHRLFESIRPSAD